MKRIVLQRAQRAGAILILALWTLGLLSAFAVYLGAGVRQKIILVKRLEDRNRLSLVAASGIRKGIAVLAQRAADPFTARTKYVLLNNPGAFANVELGEDSFSLRYVYFDKTMNKKIISYGMMSEEGKINANTASREELARLFAAVLGRDGSWADHLALALIDWRTSGESTLEGFYSENYYENLTHPYRPKNAPFEVWDELLLVEGMTQQILDRMRPFLTVYGDGRINVNTASRVVLGALGLDEDVVEKILSVRRGLDAREATEDDRVFAVMDEILTIVKDSVSPEKSQKFETLAGANRFTTQGSFYGLESQASSRGTVEIAQEISCVYDNAQGLIVYWREH